MPLAQDFFDLQDFFHADLWVEGALVWNALDQLLTYLEGQELGKIECETVGAHLIYPEKISIGEGTVIEPGAYIEGPCVIGSKCQVRHGAYLRGGVLTGNQCVIGHATEVKHSILLNGAQAPHFNYVGDSILGNVVNIGAGVICANVRLDKKDVVVEVDGKRFSTGRRKFGAVLGDGSQIGCNSVINPGVLLRKKTLVRACSSIQKSNVRIRDGIKTAN